MAEGIERSPAWRIPFRKRWVNRSSIRREVIFAQLLQMYEGPEKRILRCVFRVLHISCYGECPLKNVLRKQREQFRKLRLSLFWRPTPIFHLVDASPQAHPALLDMARNKTSVWRFTSMKFGMISAAMGRYSPRQSGPMVHA